MRAISEKTRTDLQRFCGVTLSPPIRTLPPREILGHLRDHFQHTQGMEARVQRNLEAQGVEKPTAQAIAQHHALEVDCAFRRVTPGVRWFTISRESAPFVADAIRYRGDASALANLNLGELPLVDYLCTKKTFPDAMGRNFEFVFTLLYPDTRLRVNHFLDSRPATELGHLLWEEITPLADALERALQDRDASARYPNLHAARDFARRKESLFHSLIGAEIDSRLRGKEMVPEGFRAMIQREINDTLAFFEKRPPFRRTARAALGDFFTRRHPLLRPDEDLHERAAARRIG